MSRKSHRPNSKKAPQQQEGPQNNNASAKASTAAVHVRSQADFDRRLDDPRPVVVDFWAPWCGPCRAMAPAFDRAASEMAERVQFLKVDTEQVPELAAAFGIRSIPTVIAMNGAEVVDHHVGATDVAGLLRLAQKALDRANNVTFADKLRRVFSRREPAGEEAKEARLAG